MVRESGDLPGIRKPGKFSGQTEIISGHGGKIGCESGYGV